MMIGLGRLYGVLYNDQFEERDGSRVYVRKQDVRVIREFTVNNEGIAHLPAIVRNHTLALVEVMLPHTQTPETIIYFVNEECHSIANRMHGE